MRLPLGLSLHQEVRSDDFLSSSWSVPIKRQINNGRPSATYAQAKEVTDTDTTQSPNNTNPVPFVIAVVAVTGLIIALIFLYYGLRRIRQKHKDPKYIPTKYLKNRWVNWKVDRSTSYRNNTTDHLEPISESPAVNNPRTTRSRQPPVTFDAAAQDAVRRAEEATTNGGVDRNTSVRSVMTLPAYKPSAAESEQVLGREGERAGIDVVVEYPETVSEIEELRRDEEMETLYQIRLARRIEAAERDELRRLRHEARQRNDWVALEELRASRAAIGARSNRTIDELREEHARLRDRQRAVSSVSYADLGVASHDGTRIRANSEESEQPLLGDAASMGSTRHRRDRSASSVLSIDSDFPSAGLTRPRADSRPESVRGRSGAQSMGAMSSPELVDAGNGEFPAHSPPEYEDIVLQDRQSVEAPPDYTSPIETRAPELRFVTGNDGETNGSRTSPSTEERTSGRGVGGIPQLPSLRLATLPSIVVNTPTPINPRRFEDHDR